LRTSQQIVRLPFVCTYVILLSLTARNRYTHTQRPIASHSVGYERYYVAAVIKTNEQSNWNNICECDMERGTLWCKILKIELLMLGGIFRCNVLKYWRIEPWTCGGASDWTKPCTIKPKKVKIKKTSLEISLTV